MMEASLRQHLEQETQWSHQFTAMLAELKTALSQLAEAMPTEALKTESA